MRGDDDLGMAPGALDRPSNRSDRAGLVGFDHHAMGILLDSTMSDPAASEE